MSTARFATIVDKYGDPAPHLILTAPANDRLLQAAIRTHRVMTVFQPSVGSAVDRGVIGFEPGKGRQFLIFPKSLRDQAGKRIVGIKYDLWKSASVPKAQRAAPARDTKKSGKTKPAKSRPRRSAEPNIIEFKGRDEVVDDVDVEIVDIKKKVRHAMDLLEQGKQVAAFNLLKRIVES